MSTNPKKMILITIIAVFAVLVVVGIYLLLGMNKNQTLGLGDTFTLKIGEERSLSDRSSIRFGDVLREC